MGSQKKSEDELINEDKAHKKWYWYDSNDIASDWKWRKYNVIICQWISDQYKSYLSKAVETECIDFKKCQKKFEKDQRQNIVKSMRKRPEIKEDDEDEKQGILDDGSNKKRKKLQLTHSLMLILRMIIFWLLNGNIFGIKSKGMITESIRERLG